MLHKLWRKLWWAVLPAVLIGGLTASGLAWAQTSGTPPSGSTATPRVFFATSPTRILDTRFAVGTPTAGPLGANSKIDLQVAGVGPVPANATAAAVNVTVFGTDVQSFLTVWPTGQDQPGTSLLNPQPGLILSQAASIGLGGGKLSIYNAVGATHVVVDLVGYYQDTADVPPLANVAHFLTSTANPTPDQGLPGDMYINNTTNTLFGPKTTNGWGNPIRLGGSVFLTGTTDPAADVGSVGDVYINTATNTLFGPKTAAGWGAGNPMGAHFMTGAVDPTTQGIVGDIYLNTATNTLFGPKSASGWGTGDNLNPAGQTATGAYLQITTINTWTPIPSAQVTLPPGKWFVQGKCNNEVGNTGASGILRLLNSTSGTQLDTAEAQISASAGRVPLYVGAMVNLTTTSTFQLQGYGYSAMNFNNAKIYATQLSTINGS